MSQVYFVADTHFGHRAILNYRDFDSIKEHDALIMENILAVSGKRKILWMLGDCFFTKESLEYLRIIRPKFQQVHFIIGNHDADSDERQQNIRQILAEGLVDKFASMYKKYGFWLTHAPIHPDELRGKHNIHGHVHLKTIPDERYINVSVDANDYKPVSLDSIRGI